MNYILFDGPNRDALKPLTFTRPVADLRIGGSTIREKYEFLLGSTTSTITEDYLANRYPMVEFELNILIDASFVATEELCDAIAALKENEKLVYNNRLVAFYLKEGYLPHLKIPINLKNECFQIYICLDIAAHLFEKPLLQQTSQTSLIRSTLFHM